MNMNWTEIRKAHTGDLVNIMGMIKDELDRRDAIQEKVNQINALIADLCGDLTSGDALDLMNNKTGEILLEFVDNNDYYNYDDCPEGTPDWASPALVVSFNAR